MSNGITKDGEESNNLFCRLTGFNKPERSNDPRGDAFAVHISPEEKTQVICWVEIKKNTYNQVRPYKYLPLVGRTTPTKKKPSIEKEWYVIPADVVVMMCGNKRGQHTTDAMEVVNLGNVASKSFQKYKVPEERLREKVIEAFVQGEQNLPVKKYAESKKQQYEMIPGIIHEEIRQVKEKAERLYA